jgi:hypothetical protein
VSAVGPLVAFYDISGTREEVLFYYSVLDTTHTYHARCIPKELASFLKIESLKRKVSMFIICIVNIIISLFMFSLLEHRPSLWITHKENWP